MGTSANLQGRWALVVAVAITIVMALYKVLFNGDATIAVGMSFISLSIAMFMWLFYSNMNVVQRTGSMSFIFVVAIAIVLPIFLVTFQQQNSAQQTSQYDNHLHYAAGLFATYCSTCHGLLGQGIVGPKLNNNKDMEGLTAQDLTRIITAGVPDAGALNKTQYLMPQWGQAYGGPLNENDVASLVSLVMSSEPALREKAAAPLAANGFDYVYGALITDQQRKDYAAQKAALGAPKDAPIDLTKLTAVTIPIINTPGDASAQWNFEYTDPTTKVTSKVVKVKVGTTVTWSNLSVVAHSIYSGTPDGGADNKFTDPIINVNGTFDWTPLASGSYPYYCSFHPSMVAEIIVVP